MNARKCSGYCILVYCCSIFLLFFEFVAWSFLVIWDLWFVILRNVGRPVLHKESDDDAVVVFPIIKRFADCIINIFGTRPRKRGHPNSI